MCCGSFFLLLIRGDRVFEYAHRVATSETQKGKVSPDHCFIYKQSRDFHPFEMSLHLGNLSSRVRREDLERVFRRFGRCSIQMRDKFGFVVYDYPVNAERALKTLRGKKICGEPLTLSWSNQQPKPVPKVRGYNSRQGRNSRIENYVERRLSSDGPQDCRMAYQQPDEPNDNLLEDDRWEEQQVNDLPNGNELENVSEFDRYQPYNSEDKRDDDEINHDVRQGGPSTGEDFQQRNGGVTRKTRQGCYNCGELGHKMRNCPQERASKKKLNRFDHKTESGSRGSERPSRDNVTIRSHKGSREVPSHHNERMKRTREIGSPERHRERKSRMPNSNPIHSDAKVSKYLKSRSLSPSSSSSSSFSLKSQSQRSRNPRLRSRSGSSSDTSLYISTSCGRSSTPQQKENPKLETMDTKHIKKCEEDRNSDMDGERGTATAIAMVNDESRCEKRSRVIITSEEMLMVIKHYGLKKDDDEDLGVESFFGCGRLWPWEVIYYRRLKKGPISRENYARRISQNQEFGIVDKYVRSSSGWGEEVDQTL